MRSRTIHPMARIRMRGAAVAAFLFAAVLGLASCDRTRPYVAPGEEMAPAPPAQSGAPSAQELKAQPPTKTPKGWRFTYADPGAASVHLAGSFNDWSTSATPLAKGEGGIWVAVLDLPSGSHQYKFVVNGSDWKPDPANPEGSDDGFGGKNSILVVP